MAKKKQKGNGTGTVYARKNKDGKVIGYRGSYYTADGPKPGTIRPSYCRPLNARY